MMGEAITVLIPVYNGAFYLDACIRSVLQQTLPPAAIIIVDDGSEDETPRVAAAWGSHVRYMRVEHGGLPYARNHALRLAETEIIAFVDCDDLWLPRKLEMQMAALARETKPAMVFGHLEQFVSDDLSAEESARLRVETTPVPGVAASTLLMRRRDCSRTGNFDESLSTGEFIEWRARATDAGIKTVVIPEVVARRRVHRTNMGRAGNASELHGQYVRMLKKVLDRRRGSP
jgi:glycosyltransferase involved in cell wall biosynthesis